MSASQIVRAQRAYLDQDRIHYGTGFDPLPITDRQRDARCPALAAWRNRDFLAQLFRDNGHLRLTVNRAYVDNTGAWSDGITWDELMTVKAGCGFADHWAVELYPPAADVVNVANMRHLWIVERPPFAWDPVTP